jgi:hypothetical protein
MKIGDVVQILEWLFEELRQYKPPSNKQLEVSDAQYLFLWLLKTHLSEKGPSSSHESNEVRIIKTLADELMRLKRVEKKPGTGFVSAFLFACYEPG